MLVIAHCAAEWLLEIQPDNDPPYFDFDAFNHPQRILQGQHALPARMPHFEVGASQLVRAIINPKDFFDVFFFLFRTLAHFIVSPNNAKSE